MRVEIRRIRADEGPILMRVRLLSLLDAPYAFAASYTDSIQRPAEHWAERAAGSAVGESSAIFLAHTPDDVVAMAGAYAPDDAAGVRRIWGVWVEPDMRGQGLGARLAETVMAWAAGSGADTVDLWVAESNEPAMRLYEVLGFGDSGETQAMPANPAVTERRLVRPAGRGPSA